ncbi:hypothetical protein [Aporhodopirellula aestuarii]|uniref:Secreted protein n=1 Tax=Aporhodopirellula aestuarii TaxID=2950107 RepID=A0ABT0TZ22_9BACT|nr:hypothetical protein [Aporhodopirellula aestuarii]MCM2369624.1 hypothetical protein [Aporhodopirellula aestuarii]
MKTLSLSLPLLLTAMSLIFLAGCGEDQPKSVTEGIPISEIEDYETRLKEMEAEAERELAEEN